MHINYVESCSSATHENLINSADGLHVRSSGISIMQGKSKAGKLERKSEKSQRNSGLAAIPSAFTQTFTKRASGLQPNICCVPGIIVENHPFHRAALSAQKDPGLCSLPGP
jgi:hypothetical protein